MTFKWVTCNDCERKYLNKEDHYLRYHAEKEVVEENTDIPYEYYSTVQDLLRRSKLQVVKQRPNLLVRVAPFVHREVILNDDITLEVGKTYKVQER